MAQIDRKLLHTLPKVLRARDFHLYLEGGKRITDLWLLGGKAVLGHKPPGVLREMKNAAERGLFTPFPHPAERRFIKALEEFFPGRAFRLYNDESSLRRSLTEAGFSLRETSCFRDPAFPLDGGAVRGPVAAEVPAPALKTPPAASMAEPDRASKFVSAIPAGAQAETGNMSVSLWRPFLEPPQNQAGERDNGSGATRERTVFLIPVLPWPPGPAALVLEKETGDSFPPGEFIPPVLLAPAARALYDLAAALKAAAPNRGGPNFPKIAKALARQKPGGGNPEGVLWRRRGIYLTVDPETESEQYETLFRRFLEGGFLIPPSPREPLILPESMPPGEEAKLAELLSG